MWENFQGLNKTKCICVKDLLLYENIFYNKENIVREYIFEACMRNKVLSQEKDLLWELWIEWERILVNDAREIWKDNPNKENKDILEKNRNNLQLVQQLRQCIPGNVSLEYQSLYLDISRTLKIYTKDIEEYKRITQNYRRWFFNQANIYHISVYNILKNISVDIISQSCQNIVSSIIDDSTILYDEWCSIWYKLLQDTNTIKRQYLWFILCENKIFSYYDDKLIIKSIIILCNSIECPISFRDKCCLEWIKYCNTDITISTILWCISYNNFINIIKENNYDTILITILYLYRIKIDNINDKIFLNKFITVLNTIQDHNIYINSQNLSHGWWILTKEWYDSITIYSWIVGIQIGKSLLIILKLDYIDVLEEFITIIEKNIQFFIDNSMINDIFNITIVQSKMLKNYIALIINWISKKSSSTIQKRIYILWDISTQYLYTESILDNIYDRRYIKMQSYNDFIIYEYVNGIIDIQSIIDIFNESSTITDELYKKCFKILYRYRNDTSVAVVERSLQHNAAGADKRYFTAKEVVTKEVFTKDLNTITKNNDTKEVDTKGSDTKIDSKTDKDANIIAKKENKRIKKREHEKERQNRQKRRKKEEDDTTIEIHNQPKKNFSIYKQKDFCIKTLPSCKYINIRIPVNRNAMKRIHTIEKQLYRESINDIDYSCKKIDEYISYGIGYITFETNDDAKRAISYLNKFVMNGKALQVHLKGKNTNNSIDQPNTQVGIADRDSKVVNETAENDKKRQILQRGIRTK